ncbi:hypothetical protein [Corynebacterium frankenforstense]|uniref:hypothetical protein n=1 Tax=Corynebacterium frankenforstense TaxID=1230998 RepID=UPI0026EAE859|nr:hypothetical protein [Corynebacterium frankenforstense]
MSLSKKWWAALAALAAVAVLAALGVAWAFGVRSFVMETPSMGRDIPVGSLVVTQPAQVDELEPGEVVTAEINGMARTHRVVESDDGAVRTRGDLNGGVDPVPLTDEALVGRVVFAATGLGWVIRGLPVILLAWLLFWVLTRRVEEPAQRSRYRLLGVFCGVALAIVLVRPLLGVELLGLRVDGPQQAVARTVSTGILPVEVDPAGDDPAGPVMFPVGSDASTTAHEAVDGKFSFQPRPALTWSWWLGLIGLGLSPFLGFYLQHRWFQREAGQREPEDRDHEEVTQTATVGEGGKA